MKPKTGKAIIVDQMRESYPDLFKNIVELSYLPNSFIRPIQTVSRLNRILDETHSFPESTKQ